MTLDIAMGGSTNTVLHLLAAAHEGEVAFTMSRYRPAVAPRAQSVQGGALRRRRPCRGRASRRRHPGHPGRARPGGLASYRRPDRACADAGSGAGANGTCWRTTSEGFQRRAFLPRGAPGGVRTTEAFSQDKRYDAGYRPRQRRHPRQVPCLQPRWRPGRALRQYRRGRLYREDRRRRCRVPWCSPVRPGSSKARTTRSIGDPGRPDRGRATSC